MATVDQTYTDVPAGSAIPIRLPIDPAIAGRIVRYSLYAGTAPNPLTPTMD